MTGQERVRIMSLFSFVLHPFQLSNPGHINIGGKRVFSQLRQPALAIDSWKGCKTKENKLLTLTLSWPVICIFFLHFD